jgi:putative protease
MLINCPLKSPEDISPLIQAGADCFYFGVNGKEMFGKLSGIANRRPWEFANFNSIDDVKRAIACVKEKDKKINFALNEHFYSSEHISRAVDFINKIDGIDGVIVADMGLLLRLREELPRLPLIASTGMHIQNKSAIDFFYQFGINKIVIPRHFTLQEIKILTKDYDDIDFEVFIINEDCVNIDGLCHYSHGIFDTDKIANPCQLLSGMEFLSEPKKEGRKEEILGNLSKCKNFLFDSCGACNIPFFKKIGIKSLKIVGRTLPVEKIVKDINFVKYGIANADLSQMKFEHRLQAKHKEIYQAECSKRCFNSFKS